MNVIEGEFVSISSKDPLAPIRLDGSDETDFVSIIMPMRVYIMGRFNANPNPLEDTP